MKNKIIIIGGPTAVGKSALAVSIALKVNGEVVGADSMQIYKGMDIGTGKVTASERRGVKHHMIDIVPPDEKYSVGRYAAEAGAVIDDIISRGKVPVVVGGTGLYLSAIVNGMNFSDAVGSDKVREKWRAIAADRGNRYVYDRLEEVDPVSAHEIAVNDVKRIIRALEIYEVSGKPKSAAQAMNGCKYDYYFILLECERERLYERIDRRVDEMFEDGLVDEALALEEYSSCNSMQALGYKQIFSLYDGSDSGLAATIAEVKKLTRNYAKRQMTYFRGMEADKHVYDVSEADRAVSDAVRFISENGNEDK